MRKRRIVSGRKMDDMMAMIPQEKGIWICGDLNGHVGDSNNGSSEIMGKHGMGKINNEGERIVAFVRANRMIILNTFFSKSRRKKMHLHQWREKTYR